MKTYHSDVFKEIKQRISAHDVVTYYGLEKKGAGKLYLCPFHAEKTPSFSIHKNRFHCFVCGWSGSIIDFVMKMFNLSVMDAFYKLVDDFGCQDLMRSPQGCVKKTIALDRHQLDKPRTIVFLRLDYGYVTFELSAKATNREILSADADKPLREVLRCETEEDRTTCDCISAMGMDLYVDIISVRVIGDAWFCFNREALAKLIFPCTECDLFESCNCACGDLDFLWKLAIKKAGIPPLKIGPKGRSLDIIATKKLSNRRTEQDL